MAINFVSPGDYMISLDVKDAYFSVPIFLPQRKYLRSIWRDQRYEFTCLLFGYSLAPKVLTKNFKPIVSYLRLNGPRVVMFLDDRHLTCCKLYSRVHGTAFFITNYRITKVKN